MHGSIPRRPLWSLTIALLAALAAAAPASAANFPVDSNVDAPDAATGNGTCETAAGDCTLRAAVQEANELDGADAIDLPAGRYVLSVAGAGENAAATGDLDVTESLAIVGTGRPVVDADRIDRVFHVLPEGTLGIVGLTIQRGARIDFGGSSFEEFFGGGILNQGLVALERSKVTRNFAIIGGGIGNFGVVALEDSTVGGRGGDLNNPERDGNAANIGAGIGEFFLGGEGIGTAINRSTVANNLAFPAVTLPIGAGIFSSSQLAMRDSTVSSNEAVVAPAGGLGVRPEGGPSPQSAGGGIASFGTTNLLNATINANGADVGGNIAAELISPTTRAIGGGPAGERIVRALRQQAAPAKRTKTQIADNERRVRSRLREVGVAGFDVGGIGNSIVANPTRGTNCAGAPISAGHNLEFDADTPPSCAFLTPSDIQGQNPRLGPLAFNGGPTQTHALDVRSPAVDAAENASCSPVDQRGVARSDGDLDGSLVCDIGAFEFVAPPADLGLEVNARESVRRGGRFSYTSLARNSGPGTAAAATLTLTLSEGQRFVSASDGCSYDGSSREVTCDLGSLRSGQARQVGVTVEARQPGSISATAGVTSRATDRDRADNRDVARVRVTEPQPEPPPPGPADCDIEGTPGNDVIVGTAAGEVICGGGGNDVIVGRGGDDEVRAGAGNDTVRGDDGDDTLSGGDGNDALNGGAGADRLRGEADNDSLAGGDGVEGNDTLDGGPDRDSCGADPGDSRSSCP